MQTQTESTLVPQVNTEPRGSNRLKACEARAQALVPNPAIVCYPKFETSL